MGTAICGRKGTLLMTIIQKGEPMSLTSKQIDELRAYAKDRKGELAKLINDAADTIEMLSAKLHASQMERSSQYYHNGWIPCSERLPFAEYAESNNVLATCGHRDGEDTSIRWIKTLYFNGGNWCYPTGETYEQKVYAWMPLPECYQEDI
jgi:hypothetical protein